MKVQDIVTDVRSRFGSTGKQYQDAFKAYVDAQKKALGVVSKNGQTLANTEIGAAKNLFAAARASFDKARTDGVRKIARNPQTYVPNGRAQIVSAYKDSFNLLRKTGNELSDVVSSGYKTVVGTLNGKPAEKSAGSAKASPASKATANKSSPTKSAGSQGTASRKTASSRKTPTTAKSAAAAKSTASSKSAAGTQKKTTESKRSTTKTASASSADDSAS